MKMIFVKFNLPAEHPHILSLLGLPARTSQKFKEPWVQKTIRMLPVHAIRAILVNYAFWVVLLMLSSLINGG